MKDLIKNFPKDLIKSVSETDHEMFWPSNAPEENVVICGLGGSGIGGAIASQLFVDELTTPVHVLRDYDLPAFVDERSLVIACSYSGNTEETLTVVKEAERRHCTIAVVTSGGKLAELAKKEEYSHIIIEGGQPPRSAFGKSFPKLLRMMEHYGIIKRGHDAEVQKAGSFLQQEEESIQAEAKKLAEALHENHTIIYGDAKFYGVAERFRQQLNENAKVLCCHHFFPELNHNELVGWAGADSNLQVVILRHDFENQRTAARMEISKPIIEKYAPVIEIKSKGNSILEQALYGIHLCDWASYYLSELRGVDSVEVNVIDHLKSELAKL